MINNYLLRLHFIVFLWGFTGIVGKLISLPASALVSLRMFLGAISLGILIFLSKKSFIVSKKLILYFVGIGLILGLHWLTFFNSIKISNVSIGVSTLSTGALFTALLEPLFFRRKIKQYQIILSILIVLCILWIFKTETKYFLGIILGLISSFLSALMSVLNSKIHHTADNRLIMFYQLLSGGVLVFVYSLFELDFVSTYLNVSLENLLWLLVLSVVLSAYPMVESIRLMKYITPFTLVLSVSLEPVYGIILAFLIFKDGSESMDIGFYIATIIITSIVFINAIIAKRERRV